MFTESLRGIRRVRLLWQSDWQDADEREEQERAVYEQAVVASAVAFVGRGGAMLEAFIHACPVVPLTPGGEPLFGLPPRGDLVRLLYRHRHLIQFDRNTFRLTLPGA